MKKFFLSCLLLFTAFTLSAQKGNIQTKIEKVVDDNLTWIKLTITNRGNSPIIINDMCRLSKRGAEIGRSSSYVTAMAYDRNGRQLGNSNRLSFISFEKNNGIHLKKGESEVQVFLLKSEEISGFYAPNFPLKDVQSIQLKVFLSYVTFVPNGFLNSKEEISTNTLWM